MNAARTEAETNEEINASIDAMFRQMHGVSYARMQAYCEALSDDDLNVLAEADKADSAPQIRHDFARQARYELRRRKGNR